MKKIIAVLTVLYCSSMVWGQAEAPKMPSDLNRPEVFAVLCGGLDNEEIPASCLKEVPSFKLSGMNNGVVASYKITLTDRDGNSLTLVSTASNPLKSILEKSKCIAPVELVIHDVVVMEGMNVEYISKSFRYRIR